MKNNLTIGRISIYVLLVAAVVFFGLPAWFALVNSLKSLPEIQAGNVFGFPDKLTLEAWITAWSTSCTGPEPCRGLSDYFTNSFIIVLPAALISTLWAGLNGYILSKWRFKGSDLVFAVLLFGTFLPWVLYLLPLSRIVDALGMSDSVLGLIIVHIIYSLPLALFFHNQFVKFPDDLVKAARIDGANLFIIFWRIILPLNKKIFVVVLLIQFTAIWNDFLFALILSPYDQQPISVGLNNLTNTQIGYPQYHVYMAGALIAALPTVFLYVIATEFLLRKSNKMQ